MKILFLTPQLPYPPHKGTTIRNFNLIKQVAKKHEVHLLSFIHSEEDLIWLDELRKHCRTIETVMAPPHTLWRRLLGFFFSPLPDMAFRLPSPQFAARLEACLQRERFDIVQVEGIEMARYGLLVKGYDLPATLLAGLGIPNLPRRTGPISDAALVFDDHNAEYVLQQRAWETDRRYPSRWPKALYSLVQQQKLRRYERAICLAADWVVAVSERDKTLLRHLVPDLKVTVVPNGVDSAFFSTFIPKDQYSIPPSKIRHLASIIFTGTMDFRPNIDAVVWFCQEILPLIKKEIFHIHFYIVGKSPTAEVRRLAENDAAVTVTGYVTDIRPYIAHSKVYVVPIRMGAGTKLKVLEAMAMGIPVVSTSLGIEGISVTPGQDVLVADDPADFAAKVVMLMNDERLRSQMAARGRALMEQRYDWQNIVPELEKVYQQVRGAA